MKKVLLGTTALAVAGGFALSEAQAAEVSVGGYYNQYFYIADTEAQDFGGGVTSATDGEANVDESRFDSYQDAEISFKAVQKLDNGISVQVDVQLEANDSTDYIDESYMTISGSFGSVILGSENYPNYKMGFYAPSVSSLGTDSGDVAGFMGLTVAGVDVAMANPSPRGSFNDSIGISYYSPRIAGFQLGVGFAPDSNQTGGAGGINANDGLENGINGAINYVADWDGFGINASVGGFNWGGSVLKGAGSTTGAIAGAGDSFWGAQAGLTVSFAGFALGGGWARTGGMQTATESGVGEVFSTGVSYSTGPWGVSFSYITGQRQGAKVANGPINSGDQVNIWEAAAHYSLGQGVGLLGSVFGATQDGEGLEQGTASDNLESFGGAVGIEFSF